MLKEWNNVRIFRRAEGAPTTVFQYRLLVFMRGREVTFHELESVSRTQHHLRVFMRDCNATSYKHEFVNCGRRPPSSQARRERLVYKVRSYTIFVYYWFLQAIGTRGLCELDGKVICGVYLCLLLTTHQYRFNAYDHVRRTDDFTVITDLFYMY